jgi:hypothetical protein
MRELITIESIVFAADQTLIVKVSVSLSGQPTRYESIVITGWDLGWNFDTVAQTTLQRYANRSPSVSVFGSSK